MSILRRETTQGRRPWRNSRTLPESVFAPVLDSLGSPLVLLFCSTAGSGAGGCTYSAARLLRVRGIRQRRLDELPTLRFFDSGLMAGALPLEDFLLCRDDLLLLCHASSVFHLPDRTKSGIDTNLRSYNCAIRLWTIRNMGNCA